MVEPHGNRSILVGGVQLVVVHTVHRRFGQIRAFAGTGHVKIKILHSFFSGFEKLNRVNIDTFPCAAGSGQEIPTYTVQISREIHVGEVKDDLLPIVTGGIKGGCHVISGGRACDITGIIEHFKGVAGHVFHTEGIHHELIFVSADRRQIVLLHIVGIVKRNEGVGRILGGGQLEHRAVGLVHNDLVLALVCAREKRSVALVVVESQDSGIGGLVDAVRVIHRLGGRFGLAFLGELAIGGSIGFAQCFGRIFGYRRLAIGLLKRGRGLLIGRSRIRGINRIGRGDGFVRSGCFRHVSAGTGHENESQKKRQEQKCTKSRTAGREHTFHKTPPNQQG